MTSHNLHIIEYAIFHLEICQKSVKITLKLYFVWFLHKTKLFKPKIGVILSIDIQQYMRRG